MRLIRLFPSLLTMLLMLPWGAYATTLPGPGLETGIHAVPVGQTGDVLAGPAVLQDIPPTEASIHRRCRIATLPGSLCGPDRALVSEAEGLERKSPPYRDDRSPAGATAFRSLEGCPPSKPPRRL